MNLQSPPRGGPESAALRGALVTVMEGLKRLKQSSQSYPQASASPCIEVMSGALLPKGRHHAWAIACHINSLKQDDKSDPPCPFAPLHGQDGARSPSPESQD